MVSIPFVSVYYGIKECVKRKMAPPPSATVESMHSLPRASFTLTLCMEVTMAVDTIALVAHDHKKQELLEWVRDHLEILESKRIYATGTTGRLISEVMTHPVVRLLSGPIGGDQQLGAKIAEGGIDLLVFFWDPLESLPHDPDVKALMRIAALWDIPVACNRASADYIIRSALIDAPYDRPRPDFSNYTNREL